MMRSLYIGKTGMDSSQFQLDVISNNLANVSTVGFKRSQGIFEDLYYQTLRQPGAQLSDGSTTPIGLQVGTGAVPVGTAKNFTQGTMTQTSQNFDWAITGNGFFNILRPDGSTAYTRDGQLTQNANGDIVTSDGYQLNPNINIPPTATQVTVSSTGLVQYYLANNPAAQTAGQIQLSSFVNPQGLQSVGNNLYLQSAASGDPQNGDPGTNNLGTIMQGFLEGSNVNVTEELVNMITAQRSFEMNSKVLTAADQMLQTLANLQ